MTNKEPIYCYMHVNEQLVDGEFVYLNIKCYRTFHSGASLAFHTLTIRFILGLCTKALSCPGKHHFLNIIECVYALRG